jgi:2-phospho-L-lactate/phosphoenolpyruvate guanylyltransferase
MRPWLIIPVKSLAHGKSRLAAVLSARGRRQLNELLLRRMLATAALFPGTQRTAVVSRCEETLTIARHCGVLALREPRRRGLNAAVASALRRVRARGATAVMLAACDLPRLRTRDLRAMARAGALVRGLLLCPDTSGSGTNALYLAAGTVVRFRFGRASLRGHLREARRRGLPVRLHRSARIAADIDTPAQLRRWRRELPRPSVSRARAQSRAERSQAQRLRPLRQRL